MSQRRELIENEDSLSVRKQCFLLSVHRSSLYYKPVGEKKENLGIMRIIDEHYLKHPTEGAMRVQDFHHVHSNEKWVLVFNGHNRPIQPLYCWMGDIQYP